MAMNPRLLRPLATGFNPKSIADLTAWYDGADSSPGSMTIVDGKVATWFDKSGNENNASQATGANRPTLTAGEQAGKSVLTFPGSPVFLATSLTLTPPFSIVAVIKQDARSLAPFIGPLTATNIGFGDVFVVSTSTDYNNGKWAAWGAARDVYGNNDASVVLVPVVVQSIVAGTSFPGDISFFANNSGGVATTQTAATAPGSTVDSMRIGARVGTGAQAEFFVGFIAELLIYSRALSATERAIASQGMYSKWGISP